MSWRALIEWNVSAHKYKSAALVGGLEVLFTPILVSLLAVVRTTPSKNLPPNHADFLNWAHT